ncbi:MAG: 4Fe-4S dicluster domain-containing protein [Candidatus Bathyarchaeia archaeon]
MAQPQGVWYPTIFPEKCNGCASFEKPRCVEFCPHEVFEIKDGKATVVNPTKCIYGCTACEPICPKKAIKFPKKETTSLVIETVDKGLLRKIICSKCKKTFWTNRETEVCFDCESQR